MLPGLLRKRVLGQEPPGQLREKIRTMPWAALFWWQ
jgi:hypothetical protein